MLVKSFLTALLVTLVAVMQLKAQDFSHPGAMHSKNDLDFVKSKIKLNQEPWKTAYASFLTTKASGYQGNSPKPYSSLNYEHHAYQTVRCGFFNDPNEGCYDMVYDGVAAYSLALRFYFTDDARYAAKSIEIINAWALKYRSNEDLNSRLVVSWATPWYVNAAEILRYTNNSGWTTTNTNRLNTMLNRFKNYIFWEGRPTNNWVMSAIEARLAVAVFQDDRSAFNAAVNEWKLRIKTYIYQTTDGSRPINPPGENNSYTERVWREDRSGTAYINGLCMETCRDLNHTKLGFFSLMYGAEIAWNQGVDLFKVEEKRIADFLELHSNWMLGGAVPKTICDGFLDKVTKDGFESAYSHINGRLGRNLPRTKECINDSRPTQPVSSWVKKWETLMFANRPFGTTCGSGTPPGFSNPIVEGNTVSVTNTVDIAYGACGNFVYLYEQTADIPCNNASFGEDPAKGSTKQCYTKPVFYPNIQFVSADEEPTVAENLIDDDVSDEQRWSAEVFPQSIVVDYGSSQAFTSAQLWTYLNRDYQYTIAISNDPVNGFIQVVDRTDNTTSSQPIEDTFAQTKGRYVKLTVTGANTYAGSWVSINELKMLGGGPLSTNSFTKNATFKVYPNPSTNGEFRLSKLIEWEVFDLRGVKLHSGKGTKVDLSQYAKGLYLLKSNNRAKLIMYK